MKTILTFLLLLFSISTLSSELPIKLSGSIEISIKSGTIDASFQLENIPKIDNYLIHLNAGLNIQYFRNENESFNYTPKKTYNTQYSEESFGYYFQNDVTRNKFLPDNLHFKYTGKFPVITDMDKASERGDWKGNIAFNGKTIRTDGFQTAWYPILYDIEQDKRYDEVVYDIEVSCLDCKSIFVNGSKPVTSSQGKFESDKPTSLILFAGDYVIDKYGETYYLNSRLTTEQMSELGKMTNTFEEYYEKKLGIPYGESVVYIHTTPTSIKDSWMFVAYPSIVLMNHNVGGLSNLVEKTESNDYKTLIAHELGHYYFGTYKKFNSELGDMFTESFADYLSVKLTKDLLGDKAYYKNINDKFDSLDNMEMKGIKNIKSNSDYGDRGIYVYVYAPLIWAAIEKEIGEEKMWIWLNKILSVETEKTNYIFMIDTLASVLNDQDQLAYLVQNYFANDNAVNRAKTLLKNN